MISFVVGKNAALYPFIALYLNTASLFLNSRSFSLEVVLSIASKIICSGFYNLRCLNDDKIEKVKVSMTFGISFLQNDIDKCIISIFIFSR